MEYRYVGSSGLRVSPICMGTMSFGTWSDKVNLLESWTPRLTGGQFF